MIQTTPMMRRPADDEETEVGRIDLGPIEEISIRREAAVTDGIPLDQRRANLDEGEPEKEPIEDES